MARSVSQGWKKGRGIKKGKQKKKKFKGNAGLRSCPPTAPVFTVTLLFCMVSKYPRGGVVQLSQKDLSKDMWDRVISGHFLKLKEFSWHRKVLTPSYHFFYFL